VETVNHLARVQVVIPKSIRGACVLCRARRYRRSSTGITSSFLPVRPAVELRGSCAALTRASSARKAGPCERRRFLCLA